MNIPIEEVEAKLLEKHIDPSKVSVIIKELQEVAEELKEDRKASAVPKQKWEYVIVLNDKDGFLTGKEIAGWVVQQEADANADLILGKLKDAAKSQNEAAKRKKYVMTTLIELFEGLKAKFTKEKKIRIKTKELTRVLITNGKF
jgi:hypothetical protein